MRIIHAVLQLTYIRQHAYFHAMKKIMYAVSFCCICGSIQAQDPGRYDVVLHEIMADPTPSRGMPVSEYIELRNRSSRAVNLKNWTIRTGTSTGRINTNSMLQPDSLVILCSSASVSTFQSYGATVAVTSFPALNNNGDSLLLYTGSGKLIHGLLWDKSWYSNPVKEDGGWSLEMKDVNFACEMAENWSASINDKGGTPGKMNSINGKRTSSKPLNLVYSFMNGEKELFLQFSKPINADSATIELSPQLTAVKIEEVPPLYHSLLVRFQSEADSQRIYQVKMSTIKTCHNTSAQTMTTRTGILHTPTSDKIVLNEILFNPPAGGADFIELFNKSHTMIDAGKIKIATRGAAGNITSMMHVSNHTFPLFPGEYVVISDDPSWLKAKYQPPDSIRSIRSNLPGFPDDNGTVVVLNDRGMIIDELNYDEKWHVAQLTNKEGISLERLNPDGRTQKSDNWHSASGTAGYATPGFRNSQTAGTKPVSKYVALNTKIITPDNDGRDDFVLIRYSFPKPGAILTIRIYDLAGREVMTVTNNELCGINGQYRWQGTNATGKMVNRGFYVIVAEAYYKNGQVMRFKESVGVYGN